MEYFCVEIRYDNGRVKCGIAAYDKNGQLYLGSVSPGHFDEPERFIKSMSPVTEGVVYEMKPTGRKLPRKKTARKVKLY